MLDEDFRHPRGGCALSPVSAEAQQSTVTSEQRPRKSMTADVIEVVGSDSFSTSLYGNLTPVATSDRSVTWGY